MKVGSLEETITVSGQAGGRHPERHAAGRRMEVCSRMPSRPAEIDRQIGVLIPGVTSTSQEWPGGPPSAWRSGSRLNEQAALYDG
jgi:hypothetical protein